MTGADGDGSGLGLLDGAAEPAIQMLARRHGPSITLTASNREPRRLTP
jgi:hypothetical protein